MESFEGEGRVWPSPPSCGAGEHIGLAEPSGCEILEVKDKITLKGSRVRPNCCLANLLSYEESCQKYYPCGLSECEGDSISRIGAL